MPSSLSVRVSLSTHTHTHAQILLLPAHFKSLPISNFLKSCRLTLDSVSSVLLLVLFSVSAHPQPFLVQSSPLHSAPFNSPFTHGSDSGNKDSGGRRHRILRHGQGRGRDLESSLSVCFPAFLWSLR